MPSTYTLIKGETLASSAASYTFTAIPSTFTDLVVRASIRTDRANVKDGLFIKFNSDNSSVYSETDLSVNDSTTPESNRYGGTSTDTYYPYVDGNTATSNTFANTEFYVPNYTASQNKPLSLISMAEGNTTNFSMGVSAGLYRNTVAINSIDIKSFNAANLLAGSSFYLYGIKNS